MCADFISSITTSHGRSAAIVKMMQLQKQIRELRKQMDEESKNRDDSPKGKQQKLALQAKMFSLQTQLQDVMQQRIYGT